MLQSAGRELVQTVEEERIDVKERYDLGYDRDPFCSLRPASPCSGPARHLQPPCKRCQQSGTPCIFEKPEKKNVQGLSNGGLESVQTYLSCQVVC